MFPAAVRELAGGTDLIKRGQRSPDVFLLRRGWTFTYRILPDGRRQILHFALPEEILNHGAGISGVATESIQALTDAAVSGMPREQLGMTARLTPEIGHQLATHLERCRLLAYEHMTNIGRRSARERIASLLLELYCRVHRRLPAAPNDSVPMPLTQNVIADALGLTSVHVNRTLGGLRDEGIARLRHGTLHVLDPERFVELGDLSSELLTIIARASERDAAMPRAR
jgi:CRP-like cAMP-binding protein